MTKTNFFAGNRLAILCLAAMFLIGAVGAATAQTDTTENKVFGNKTSVKILYDLVRAKRGNNSFVLLTPEDLEKISANDSENMSAVDPCEMGTPISFGQTLNGQLSTADCRLDDNSFADFYYFNGNAGQQVTISMSSAAFDTYLGLANEDATFIVEDDDGGGGTNSRIVATLPATGLYVILANSALENKVGDYALSLTVPPSCTYALVPTGAEVPAAGGSFTFAVNTQPGCFWSSNTDPYPYFINSNGGGSESGTATYTVTPNDTGAARTGIIRVSGQIFTVTQPPLVCTYSISSTGANVSATANSGSFTINTPAGCFWAASSPSWFISVQNSGRGTATINYTVAANNGADRTGTISIAGLTFTITQPGLNCTFSVSPTNVSVNRAEHFGTINVTTQPGCSWSTSGGFGFVTLEYSSVTGAGVISYRIYANNSFGSRTNIITVYGLTPMNITFTQSGIPYRTRFDFDGDSKADIGFYRPSDGRWMTRNSQTGAVSGLNFGLPDDIIAPADYDGDRLTDIAVFRPSSGVWYRINSSNNSFSALQFGLSGDIPVPGDYDGDGKADIAVYRPSNGVWYRVNSSNSQVVITQFGLFGDKPQIADYDGDGKTDLAVYRPSDGIWYVYRSIDSAAYAIRFGLSEDAPVPADYDGDGKADIAVFRPATGIWYIFYSGSGQVSVQKFGNDQDVPVPADYDGDGKVDIGIYRPSTGDWWSMGSLYGSPTVNSLNVTAAVPIATAFGRKAF